jgi:hypothetical protein
MQYATNMSTVLEQDGQEIIEIRLWSLYLLTNRTTLYNEIIEASLDHGPVEKNPQNPGRITFRFSAAAWHSKIKKLLYSYRIPVIVRPDSLLQQLRYTSQRQSVV